MGKSTEYVIIAIVVVIVALAVLFAARHPVPIQTWSDAGYGAAFQPGHPTDSRAEAELAYSDFLARVDKNEVHGVTIRGHSITGDWIDGKKFRTYAPNDPSLIETLTTHRVAVNVMPAADRFSLRNVTTEWLPVLLLIGVLLYFLRRTQVGGRQELGLGRSHARLIAESSRRVTFADVAGIDEARQELGEIVEFLKRPAKFLMLGGRIPKGCLLVGPPGTGKTLLARAVAGEADVPFYAVAGSAFVEMFVGVGASRVRDMFAEAKSHAPCIIFIDELDSVGRRRGAGLGGGSDEREQTLNQLLVEMDGFDGNEGVIVIAATNRPDVLDPALLRPGRFDRQVVVPNPDIAGRKRILEVHLRKVPAAANIDLQALARGTPGFSGADLANLVNEASLRAARSGAHVVGMEDLESAKEKILMGAERRSVKITVEDREMTAYHEAGHALIALLLPGNDPLHKVTIVPRGKALGITVSLREHDRLGFSRQELDARIAMMFGGRVAEELIYGASGVTTGAIDDIRRATALARRMVTEFGFSEELGPLHFAEDQDGPFLDHSITRHMKISEATAAVIDEEIRDIARHGEATARWLLTLHRDDLHLLAQALIERETLSKEEIQFVLRGGSSDAHGGVNPPKEALMR